MPGSTKFPTTAWSLVLSAGHRTDLQSTSALATLCESYWYPLYAFIRRRGHSVDEAQDLTQEFFARLLEKRFIDRADREKGRFRSFLLSSLKFFLSDEADRRNALKRGGPRPALPFEMKAGEDAYLREAFHSETPERVFERRWALTLLDRVVNRLRLEFASVGRAEQFDRLKVFLLGTGEAPYAKLAEELGTSEGALKVSISRLRKQYRDFLRAEILATVADPGEVDGEIRYLLAVLAQK